MNEMIFIAPPHRGPHKRIHFVDVADQICLRHREHPLRVTDRLEDLLAQPRRCLRRAFGSAGGADSASLAGEGHEHVHVSRCRVYKLGGSVPPELANLQKLTSINLKFNGLSSSDAALNSFLGEEMAKGRDGRG